DIILVNMNKPHLTPRFMIPYRLVCEAYGQDVDTVIVDGKIIMRERIVKTIDEESVLKQAQRVAEEVVEQNSLEKYLEIPKGFWGCSKYP
ncbi:unnamed protein product, partial [marine sediment metagenome]